MSAGAERASRDRSFSELRARTSTMRGGKGANLGELTAAGCPSPAGSSSARPPMRSSASRRAARACWRGSSPRLTSRTPSSSRPPPRRPSRPSRRPDAPGPEGRDRRLLRGARRPGEGSEPAVAVRSSATAEDTASASFAGMNETFLNVRGADAVIDAVRRCWVSLFVRARSTTAASAASARPGWTSRSSCQIQILSTRAGVMFTANPASGANRGARDRGIVRPRRGRRLGQRLSRPLVVQKSDLAITTRSVRPKELVIEPAEDGGTVTRRSARQRACAPFSAMRRCIELAQLGKRIEAHYGSPQDTEWSFDPRASVWMLQSRPITTLAAAGSPPAATGRGRRSPPGRSSCTGSVRPRAAPAAPSVS